MNTVLSIVLSNLVDALAVVHQGLADSRPRVGNLLDLFLQRGADRLHLADGNGMVVVDLFVMALGNLHESGNLDTVLRHHRGEVANLVVDILDVIIPVAGTKWPRGMATWSLTSVV